MKIGAGYGEVSSAWANRGQPANSKGGNWWQSPLCGAHTDRHFRESLVSPRGYFFFAAGAGAGAGALPAGALAVAGPPVPGLAWSYSLTISPVISMVCDAHS